VPDYVDGAANMSERDRLFEIGKGNRCPMACYLGWTYTEALTDWIVRQAQTLCPTEQQIVIPKSIKKLPRGGWPERWVFEL
jgi:hypothetical protein